MTPELGETADPRLLVPGAPETIEADAAALTAHGRRIEQVGTALRTVRVPDWHGDAGARFAGSWAGEPPRWLKTADAIGLIAATLTGYAGTLRWAQGRAGEAVRLWDQGDEVSARAAFAETDELCLDPGEPLREQAREVLEQARSRVREAGDVAARALGGGAGAGRPAGGSADTGPGALAVLVDALTGSASTSGPWGTGGVWRASVQGLGSGLEASGPELDLAAGELSLGEVEAHADVVTASAEGTFRAGDLTATGKADGGVGLDLAASGAVSKDGLSAQVDVGAGARAKLAGEARYGPVRGAAEAEARGGAWAAGTAEIGKAGVSLGGEVGAGAKAGVSASVEVAGITLVGKAEGIAGAAALGDVDFEFRDGKFHVGAHGGVAMGLGGALGGDVTVDPEEFGHTALAAADAVGAGLDDLLGLPR
jgi:hypothetical protein